MRIELTHKGFADLSLTTWVPRPKTSTSDTQPANPQARACLLVTCHSSLLTEFLERETGVEPATSTLARSHSTTELLPLARAKPLTSIAQIGL